MWVKALWWKEQSMELERERERERDKWNDVKRGYYNKCDGQAKVERERERGRGGGGVGGVQSGKSKWKWGVTWWGIVSTWKTPTPQSKAHVSILLIYATFFGEVCVCERKKMGPAQTAGAHKERCLWGRLDWTLMGPKSGLRKGRGIIPFLWEKQMGEGKRR